jgi:transposase
MTLSLCAALEAIGFATSGEAGACLATSLRMPTAAATMLRRIKAAPAPVCEGVTKVGIDDFAFRRSLKYGTILVDLETHRVIDLLPDRATQTATAWFKAHPEIEVLSRDRGADYATAAAQGAPQAIQVADHWHLVHNLAEALALVLEDYQAQLRNASQALAPATVKEAQPRPADQEAFVLPDAESAAPHKASGPAYRTPVIQHVQRARRERRLALYQQLVTWQHLAWRPLPSPNRRV